MKMYAIGANSAIRALAGGVSLIALASAAHAVTPPFSYGGLTWTTDRYTPDNIQILGTHNGKSNVLQLGFGPLGEAEARGGLNGSFWQYQGIAAQTNLPGSRHSFLTMSMWVPTAWGVNVPGGSLQDVNAPNNYLATIINGGTNTHVDASMWGEIPSAAPPGFGAYPTWGFLNDAQLTGSTPDMYLFDGEVGNLAQRGAGTVNYGAWNTLSMEYRDTEVRFFLNGVLSNTYVFTTTDPTFAGDPANTFKTWIINQFNYETAGANNYNNFSAALSDYFNYYYADLNYGVFTNTVTTLTTALPDSADLIVESGTTTVAAGAGTTGAQGLTRVLAAGTLINNGTLSGLVTNAGTATNAATGIMNAGLLNAGTAANAGTINGGVNNTAGTFSSTGIVNGGLTNAAGATANLAGQANGAVANAGTVNLTAATTGITTFTQSGAGAFNLGGFSTTIGSLAGVGSVNLGAGVLTTGGNNTSTSYTGTFAGTGGIVKTGTGKFSTGPLANTGTNSVNAGELNVNGAIAGNVVVNAGGIFSGTNTITGNLTNNAGGSVRPGNSPGTIAVLGNYIGGGTLVTEVVFNSAGAPVNGTTHDFLNITGNVSNVTALQIVAFAPSTAPTATTGNGIELVRVGGTTTAGAFVLTGPVVQGGFEYTLKYLADYAGTTDGYFLQSGVRQEIAAISGANMGSAALNAACSSANDRIEASKNSRRHGWVSVERGSLETGAASGLDSDGDTTCVNTGMSFASGIAGVNMGFDVHFGSYDGDLTLVSGAATLEGSRYGAEAFLTYAKDMFFASAAAGFASQDFEFAGTLFRNTGGASGLTANLAAGVHVPVAGVADLTLAGIVDYNDAVCGDACFGFATYAEGDAIMTGTLQAKAKASYGPFAPYAALSYSTVFSDDGATVLGASTTSFTGDGLFAGTLGANLRLSDAASLFVEGKYKEASDADAKGQSVAAGIRAAW
jgi:hypothetical protein